MQISWVGWSTTFSSSSIKVLPELIGVRCKSWVWWELIGRAVQDQKDGAASTSSYRTGKIPKNYRKIIFQNWQNPKKNTSCTLQLFCNYPLLHLSTNVLTLVCLTAACWENILPFFCQLFCNRVDIAGDVSAGIYGIWNCTQAFHSTNNIFKRWTYFSWNDNKLYYFEGNRNFNSNCKGKTASRPHPCKIQNFSLDIHV